jgi:hypothetical protein
MSSPRVVTRPFEIRQRPRSVEHVKAESRAQHFDAGRRKLIDHDARDGDESVRPGSVPASLTMAMAWITTTIGRAVMGGMLAGSGAGPGSRRLILPRVFRCGTMAPVAVERGSIKGVVLKSRLGFVRDNKGEAGLRSVLARLPEADRATLDSLLPSSWYPFEMGERLDKAIAQEMGRGNEIFTVLGERSAADNLGTSHRAFVDGKDPHGLLRHAASIHQAYYDTG